MRAADRQTTTPAAFQVMVKPRGPICNLACAYCYYLSKERLYPGGHFRMTNKLLEEFTRQYIEAQCGPEVTFCWQGGEPTLVGLDFFRLALEHQQKYRRPGIRIHNALQTNGTLLDDEWCRFFREHDFLIGLSLDGPGELHDAYRVDKAGKPTFDAVIDGLALLKKHSVEFNVLTCIHAANAEHPLDIYRFLRDEAGAHFIQFIPIVDEGSETGFQEGKQSGEYSVTGQEYGEFLISIFDEWVRRDVSRVFVQVFDAALAAWTGERPALCVFDETCGNALVLEHNGDLYACDHFVEPRFRLGNIQKTPLVEMVGSEKLRKFGLVKRDALPRYCRECEVRFVCNGGCPKNRVMLTPDGEPGLNYLCEGYKALFTHIDGPMQVMATELRAGRPPANIMLYLAKEEAQFHGRPARPRRNHPCPCGSGLKFKHCHRRQHVFPRPPQDH